MFIGWLNVVLIRRTSGISFTFSAILVSVLNLRVAGFLPCIHCFKSIASNNLRPLCSSHFTALYRLNDSYEKQLVHVEREK